MTVLHVLQSSPACSCRPQTTLLTVASRRRFKDSRRWCCAAYNEVAIDYNAAFTGAVARLVDFYDNMKPFSDCTLDLGWTHPNATLVRPLPLLGCV